MRKPVVVVAALVLLAGAAGATVNIERPAEDATFTDSPFVPLRVAVSGESGDLAYTVNGGDEEDCRCTDQTLAVDAAQGWNTFRVFMDGEQRDRVSVYVDTEKPDIIFTRPAAGIVLDPAPDIRIYYNDTTGIDADAVQVTLDGEPVQGNTTRDRFTARLDGIGEGTFTVGYTVPDTYWDTSGVDHNATGSWNFTLPIEPVITGTRPTGTVGGSPTVAVTLKDPAGIDPAATSLTVVRDGETVTSVDVPGGTTVTKDIGTAIDGLQDGEYTARLRAVDGNGNEAQENWTFTVDTTAPDADIVSPGNGTVAVGEETVTVAATDALSAVRRVNVSIASESVTATRDGDRFTATLDTRRVGDGTRLLRATAVDAAGNAATATTRVRVDNEPPTVSNVTVYPEPVVAGMLAEARVTDGTTAIVGARWRVTRQGGDEVLAEGRLNAVGGPYDSQQERVRAAAPLDLSDGTYVLSIRAKDDAGHWSNGYGPTFEVDTGDRPDLSMAAPARIHVVRGRDQDVTLSVANTGDADEFVRMEADADVDVTVEPATERVQEGENRTFTVRVDAPDGREMLGPHNVTVVADGLTDEARITRPVIVQPVPERQDAIAERYSTMRERFAELNESRHDMDIEDENVSSRLAAAAAAVERIDGLLAEGRYHAAARAMNESSDVLVEAENTFTAAATQARLATAKSIGLRLLLVALFLGIVVGAYRLVPAPDGFDPDEGFVHRPDGKHPVRVRAEAAVKRLRERFSDGEEADDRPGPWSGF